MRTTAETLYDTDGGIAVRRISRELAYGDATAAYVARLDAERGCVFSSTYEYPGRYTRWDFALINPPVAIEATGYDVEEVDRENAADAARATGLGLRYRTSPGETQGARATPQQTPDPNEE